MIYEKQNYFNKKFPQDPQKYHENIKKSQNFLLKIYKISKFIIFNYDKFQKYSKLREIPIHQWRVLPGELGGEQERGERGVCLPEQGQI